MGPTFVLISGLCLLTTTASFPTNDTKDQNGLVSQDSPQTLVPASPEPSPAPDNDLKAELLEVFGASPASEQEIKHDTKPDDGNCSCVLFKFCREPEHGEVTNSEATPDECDSLLRCCERQYIPPPSIALAPTPYSTSSHCGVRNTKHISASKEATGKKSFAAEYGEFPWMVAVLSAEELDDETVNVYQCGGSLIHPQVVLTGAHCVYGKDNLIVRAGEWDTEVNSETSPSQDLLVQQMIVHERFNNGSLANDPALLILEAPVDMSAENVGLICLPEPNEIMDGRNCVASGWGKDQHGEEGKFQAILKKVDLPIVAREPCQEALRHTKLGPYFKLHETFLCAGGIPGQDTCKGDGGSPLVCPKANSGEYVQAGIVAWGIGCNTATPGVYVNVPYFVHWIYDTLQERGFTFDSTDAPPAHH